MWFMSRPTIRGWFTGARLSLGPDGTHIPAFGTTVRTSRSELASVSVFLVASGGDGATGDSIGTIATRFMIAEGITHGAARSITATLSIEAAEIAAGVLTGPAALDPSVVTGKLLADTRNPAARAALAPVRSVVTGAAAKQGRTPHGEAPALEAGERAVVEAVVVVAGTTDRGARISTGPQD